MNSNHAWIAVTSALFIFVNSKPCITFRRKKKRKRDES
jgi:hypothetical protein